MTLVLAEDGAERVGSALSSDEIGAVAALFRLDDRPGARLRWADLEPIAQLLGTGGAIEGVAARLGGPAMRPVRAILLDKSPDLNWGLGWHQDRVIAVEERREVPGFTSWSDKGGLLHVQAPAALMAGMLTLRIHVDAVDEESAPLKVLKGSHRLGRLSEDEICQLAATMPQATCLAGPGDIWVYRTPIVHASDPLRNGSSRRVLQLDYADFDLPGGLRWAYAEAHSAG